MAEAGAAIQTRTERQGAGAALLYKRVWFCYNDQTCLISVL